MSERREGKILLVGKYRRPSGKWRIITVGLPLLALTLAVTRTFHYAPFGFSIMPISYSYALLAAFIPLVYLWIPFGKKSPRKIMPWYDIILAALSLGIPFYFISHNYEITVLSWETGAPAIAVAWATVLLLLVLEASRRAGGLGLLITVLAFAFFPMFSCYMPIRILWGPCYDFPHLISAQVISELGLIGIPMGIFGSTLLGFLVFAIAIQACGAGQFFTDLALSFVGKTRCGNAKVAVVASALFGTISGAAVPNVMTTGCFTIPAMKKEGLPPEFAGAVEATASSAGGITPPVMGAVAFIMSEFTGIPYADICIAAAVPAALFYLCVFSQIDAFAARIGLKPPQLTTKPPPIWKALLKNFHIVGGMAALVFILFFFRMSQQAPWMATAIMIVLAMLQKHSRISPKDFVKLIESMGRTLCDLCAMLSSVGLLIGAFTFTGIALTIPHQIVSLAGENVFALVLIGAAANLILGTGLTTTAVYIFLALVLAPGLVAVGLTVMAVHLYIIYIGEFSHTTPPVGLAAYAAAAIAETDAMKVMWVAMKLGTAKYILPFIFVMSPALILRAPLSEILWAIPTAAIGFVIIAGALEGYFWFVGNIRMLTRALLFIAGFLTVLPAGVFGISINLVGIGIFAVIFIMVKMMKASASPVAKVFVG